MKRCYCTVDTPLSRVLEHIGQIKPILQRNSDVIAFLKAGFVGYWGEWHTSTNNLTNAAAECQIVEALLDALPQERMIALRYNVDKRAIYGNAPISATEAFGTSSKARIRAHNDCLGASDNDWGTSAWRQDGNYEPEKQFLEMDDCTW